MQVMVISATGENNALMPHLCQASLVLTRDASQSYLHMLLTDSKPGRLRAVFWPFFGASRLQMHQSKCLCPCQCQLSKPSDEYWLCLVKKQTNKKCQKEQHYCWSPPINVSMLQTSLAWSIIYFYRAVSSTSTSCEQALWVSLPTQRRDSYFLSSSTRLSWVCFCGEVSQQLFLRTRVLKESQIPKSPGWALALPHISHQHLPPYLIHFVFLGLDDPYLILSLKRTATTDVLASLGECLLHRWV